MAAAIGLRAWFLDRQDYDSDDAFRAAVAQELVQTEYLSYRLGIAVVSAPIRAQLVLGGEYETVGWTFRTATVPAVRFVDPDPEDLALAKEQLAREMDHIAEPPEDEEPEIEPEPADVAY